MKKNTAVTSLISGSIISFFWGENQYINIPRKIGRYKIVSEISTKNSTRFLRGIYQLTSGKKVFIKVWMGKLKDLNYFLLQNEYIVNLIISSKLHSNIRVPRIIEVIKKDQLFALVYEYQEGKLLSSFNTNYQANIIAHILNKLKLASQELTNEEKKMFPKRSPLLCLLSLPIFTLFVLINYFEHRKIIIGAFISCMKGIVNLNSKGLFIAHRDLKPENILITGSKIYLLDCEHMVLTYKNYDFCKIVISQNNKKLTSLIKNKLKITTNNTLLEYICISFGSSFGRKNNFTEKYVKALYKIGLKELQF